MWNDTSVHARDDYQLNVWFSDVGGKVESLTCRVGWNKGVGSPNASVYGTLAASETLAMNEGNGFGSTAMELDVRFKEIFPLESRFINASLSGRASRCT